MSIKTIVAVPKNFVIKHKTPIAFIAGGAITGALIVAATKESFARYDSFLEEHDLVAEFVAYPLLQENN